MIHPPFYDCFTLVKTHTNLIVKLPAHRAGLPGKEISLLIVPLDPAYKTGLAGHLPAKNFPDPPIEMDIYPLCMITPFLFGKPAVGFDALTRAPEDLSPMSRIALRSILPDGLTFSLAPFLP